MIALFLILILMIYAVTIAQLIKGFEKIPVFVPNNNIPNTYFSIIVPFRNEVENLPLFLESIRNLNYPKALFELILVDDFSTDESVKLIYNWRMVNGEFQFTLLENHNIVGSPKKNAIMRAIPIIKENWLITTDADCIVPPNWLLTLDNYLDDNDVSMIAGPVLYSEQTGFLSQFQQLDVLSLQGATIGSFGMNLGFMCNAANFSYKKSFFNELGGFGGNNHLASGDDVFLLQKAIAVKPEKVRYLKSDLFIVKTQPTISWKLLFNQRVRWASKTKSYESIFGKDLAIIVFAGNLGWILAIIFYFFTEINVVSLSTVVILKVLPDVILLQKSNALLRQKPMRYLIFSILIYPFFCIAVALYSLFGTYEWKGRKF